MDPGPVATGPACPAGPDLWMREEPDGSFTVGLTREARGRIGPVAFYGPPTVGHRYAAGEPAFSIESGKWVGHLPLPAPGTVVATNEPLRGDPRPIHDDPLGEGWLFRMRPEDPAGPGRGNAPPRPAAVP